MSAQPPHPPRPPACQHRAGLEHSEPARWAGLAVAAALVLTACTSSPGSHSDPAAESELSPEQRDPALVLRDESLAIEEAEQERDPALVLRDELLALEEAEQERQTTLLEERERLLLELDKNPGVDPDPDPDPWAAAPQCADRAAVAQDDEVLVCFVAFGDATLDGSGPDQAIKGVRILIFDDSWTGADRRAWWQTVNEAGVSLVSGQQLRSTAESIAAAPVPSVVTGADGIATVAVKRREYYGFCAVDPGDGGLIAGCDVFDTLDPCCFPFIPDQNKVGYRAGGEGGISFFDPLVVYVYFSRGRAFFSVDGGRYARFVAGETHPEGTGKVTLTGYRYGAEYFDHQREVPLLLDQDHFRLYAIVEDADIGEFWEAVRSGWRPDPDAVSQLSGPAEKPATLVRTGADGTATAELAAGDYLFCDVGLLDDGVVGRVAPCTYEDVTAGQDRMIYDWSNENGGYLNELNEPSSAQIREEMTTCNPSGEPHWCATTQQWQQARQHYEETGQAPAGWPDP